MYVYILYPILTTCHASGTHTRLERTRVVADDAPLTHLERTRALVWNAHVL